MTALRALTLAGVIVSGLTFSGLARAEGFSISTSTGLEAVRATRAADWWLSGAGLIDLDGDDDLDLFLSSHGSYGALTALNDGKGHFTLGTGTFPKSELHLPADVDGDGKVDLSATWSDGGGQWWLNKSTPGNVSFKETDVIRDGGQARQQALVDVDGDGKLDWLRGAGAGVLIDLGDGKGGFASASRTLANPGGEEIAIVPADVDGDGDQDLFVEWGRYDSYGPDGASRLYRNDGGGKFTNVTTTAGLREAGFAVQGVGDFDQDGDTDVIALEERSFPQSIYLNDGHGAFTKKAGAITGGPTGKAHYGSWGLTVMTDFDNDGIGDLVADGRNYLHVLRGTGGGAFVYANQTWGGIVDDAEASVDAGFTFGDIDRDGDLDLIGYKTVEPRNLNVYVNGSPAKSWINVRPVGLAGNRPAAGAEIRVYAAGTQQLLWFEEISLYSKQVQQTSYALGETERHYGLGGRATVDVAVRFHPSNKVVRRDGVAANSTVRLSEDGAGTIVPPPVSAPDAGAPAPTDAGAGPSDASGAAGTSGAAGVGTNGAAGTGTGNTGTAGTSGNAPDAGATTPPAASGAAGSHAGPADAGSPPRQQGGGGCDLASASTPRSGALLAFVALALTLLRRRVRLSPLPAKAGRGRRPKAAGEGRTLRSKRNPLNSLLLLALAPWPFALASCSGGAAQTTDAATPSGTAGTTGAAGTSSSSSGSAGTTAAAGTGATNSLPDAAGAAGATAAAGTAGTGASPPPTTFATGVRVHLQRTFAAPKVISFGLPVPPGAVKDATAVRFTVGGAPVDANVKPLLAEHDANGAPTAVRALLVQVPASILAGDAADLDVAWSGPGRATGAAAITFASADVSAESPELVATATRTIQASGGTNKLVEGPRVDKTLFTAREPRVLATFPDGYLAATGILGRQVPASAMSPGSDAGGLAFLSENARKFGASAMYAESYPLNPDGVVDPVANFEGWLYDRCATFLTFYTHTGDARFLRHAYRSCSYYAGKIGLAGETSGIFTGKAGVDPKYSHLRGLYAYYALTGDEGALTAGKAIANMWRDDQVFVASYRAGHLRGPDKLWTERLLGTSLEGLYYGHRLTGDAQLFAAFKDVLATAYRHITGDAAALATLNPGVGPFPPQSCFIHSAAQHDEGDAADPWCSIWMSELTIDSLLQYQAQTGDPRVDEIFVRLVRYLRDVGSQYLTDDLQDDTFMKPKACYVAGQESARRLVPIYGSGLLASGQRRNFGATDDDEHCTDATALTAAGLRALVRQGKFDAKATGPFATEGESFLALHHEFAACAKHTFEADSRTRRDPTGWTSGDLAAGVADPAAFIASNLIGYPKYPSSPQRKLSWWFNVSMLQAGLLSDAGVKIPALQPGKVQPASCQ